MTKLEKQCRDMADVCELAHQRTARDCKKKGINVNCLGSNECEDIREYHGNGELTHYGTKAQDIFNRHYDYICEVTGI